MARTDNQSVRATFDADFESQTGDSDDISAAAVTQWIDMANDIVDDIADADSSIGSSRLTNIETLVAQHFLATQAQRASSQSGSSRRIDYQGETGMGFDGTKYGQQAQTLDPTGTLSASNKPAASVSSFDVKEADPSYD